MRVTKNVVLSVKKCLDEALRYNACVDVCNCYPGEKFLEVHSPFFAWPYSGRIYSVCRSASYVEDMVMDYERRKNDVQI